MIESISSLLPLWDVIEHSFTTTGTTGQLLLGANPLRWIVAFQLPNPAIGTSILRAWSQSGALHWNMTTGTDQPIVISQRDWGPVPCGAWYFDSGGAFTVTCMELIWKG